MKLGEVQVGKTYKGELRYPLYGAKVTVIAGPGPEQDLWAGRAGYGARSKQRGWLVRIDQTMSGAWLSDGAVGQERFVWSRQLAWEWGEKDDEREAQHQERDRRVSLLKLRLGSDRDLRANGGLLVTHDLAASERLLDRLEREHAARAAFEAYIRGRDQDRENPAFDEADAAMVELRERLG